MYLKWKRYLKWKNILGISGVYLLALGNNEYFHLKAETAPALKLKH